MTTEEMKKAWEELSLRVASLESTLAEQASRSLLPGARTSLNNLAARYNKFRIIAFVFIFLSFLYSRHDIVPNDMGLPLALTMSIYFAVCAFIDNILYHRVKSIDVSAMSVREVVKRAMSCRRLHLQSLMLLIPFMLVVVVLLFYAFRYDKYVVYGMAAGLVLGLGIGISAFCSFMRDYARLRMEEKDIQ